MNRKDLLTGFLIFSLTVLLRLYDLENKFVFHAEFNYKLWPVKEIIYDHKLKLIGIEAVSYLHHIHYPPMTLYIFAPIIYFFNGEPLSIEIFIILLSGLTSILLYFLISKVVNKEAGLIGALLYSISFFVYLSDRFIWVVGTMLFFSTAFLVLIYLISKSNAKSKRANRCICALGLLTGLALNFHFQATAFIFSALIFIYTTYKNAARFKKMFLFLLFTTIPLSPLLIFELRHNFYNIHGILILFKDSSGQLSTSLIANIQKSALAYSKIWADIFFRDLASSKVYLYLIFITQLLIFGSLYRGKKQLTKPQSTLLVISIHLSLFGLFSFPFIQNKFYDTSYYLFYMIPVFIFIISLSVSKIIYVNKNLSFAIYTLILIFSIININRIIKYYPSGNYQNQKNAITYIINNAPSNDFYIKFIDFNSEEIDYLFYYISKKSYKDYRKIHYIERWHVEGKYHFSVAVSPQQDAKQFGKLSVKKYF